MQMESELFCPRCGRTSKEVKFIGGFCRDCWLHDHPKALVAPEKLEIVTCGRCGSKLFDKGKWVLNSEENVQGFILSHVKVSPEIKTQLLDLKLVKDLGRKELAAVKLIGLVGTTRVELEKNIDLKRSESVCASCNKAAGNYFEATIQMRFASEDVEKRLGPRVLEEITQKLKELHDAGFEVSQIVRLEEKKNGFDVVIGNRQAAKQASELIARRHSGQITVSKTLAGMKEGKDVYRMTYCVRV